MFCQETLIGCPFFFSSHFSFSPFFLLFFLFCVSFYDVHYFLAFSFMIIIPILYNNNYYL